MEAYSREQLAMLAVDDGRIHEAVPMLRESLALYRDLDAPSELAECLSSFATVAAAARAAEVAAQLLSNSRARFEEQGIGTPWYVGKREEATLARIHEQLDEESFARAWEEGAALTVDAAIALALALDVKPDA
jgi:hypothetical protein